MIILHNTGQRSSSNILTHGLIIIIFPKRVQFQKRGLYKYQNKLISIFYETYFQFLIN